MALVYTSIADKRVYVHANKHLCLSSLQNKLGDTPLHNAAWKGHADVVGALLERG